MTASVLTIILNWRTADMTLRAAESALRAMDGVAGAITIVDNDSGDGSEDVLRKAVADRGWNRVQVVQAGRNGGFGAGNNAGIIAGMPDGTRPDLVWILNSDAFPAPDAGRLLRDHLQAHPEVGMAGSYIEGVDGVPHGTCFRFPSIASEFEAAIRLGLVTRALRHYIVPMDLPAEGIKRVDWTAGCSLMIRTRLLDEIGLFDERFFLYFEETDLCLRAARAGWPTDYVRASKVVHIGSETTGMKRWKRTPRYWFDSRRHYFTKNHGRAYAALATGAHVAGGLLWRLRCALTGRDRGDPPHFLRDLVGHALSPAAEPSGTPPSAQPSGPANPVRSQS